MKTRSRLYGRVIPRVEQSIQNQSKFIILFVQTFRFVVFVL